MAGRVREWTARLLLMTFSFLVAILVAELLTRLIYPISDGRENVTLNGHQITSWLEKNTVYRQVSNEYDVLTTITDKGHRVPNVDGNPDVIFVGDSFTFGWGVADTETFVSIYCDKIQISCANLGEPGTGTSRQLDNLERFLEDWSWEPRSVKLFVFAMTASFSSGNDLADNFDYGRRVSGTDAQILEEDEQRQVGPMERVIGLQRFFLKNSNLIRIAKYHWGPALRSTLVPELEEERLIEALEFTKNELARLEELSAQHGFTYEIFLIHPVQDIIRNTYKDTLGSLNEISPKQLHTTAHLFLDSPAEFYYSYDGHLNGLGAARIAEFLISREETKPDSAIDASH